MQMPGMTHDAHVIEFLAIFAVFRARNRLI